jgi:hypothetical protein
MKAFYGENTGWLTKVNFVDKNNVLVGFDFAQSCCEDFDWFISDEIKSETIKNDKTFEQVNEELKDFYFDTSFIAYPEASGIDDNMVVFKLIKRKNGKPKYLHLWNCHNGYYSHGFEMGIGNEIIHEGSL